jgi:hypothetical protein
LGDAAANVNALTFLMFNLIKIGGSMIKKLLYLVFLSVIAIQAQAAMVFSDRTLFESQLSTSITDGYDSPLYSDGTKTDAAMSAFLGETQYQTTGFTNLNFLSSSGGSRHYCAGCNGSYLLDFTSTSVGNAAGVFGVGLDVFGGQDVFGTTAFVTFGDSSTANFAIPDISSGNLFWGLTDSLLISSIHFGLLDGASNTSDSIQRMAMDNLTIGSMNPVSAVPVPAAVWLFGTALIGFVGMSRRRKVA